jgi:hypothetical protein
VHGSSFKAPSYINFWVYGFLQAIFEVVDTIAVHELKIKYAGPRNSARVTEYNKRLENG